MSMEVSMGSGVVSAPAVAGSWGGVGCCRGRLCPPGGIIAVIALSEISMRMPATWPGCMLAAAEVLCLLVPLLAGVPLGQGERCFDRIDILFG